MAPMPPTNTKLQPRCLVGMVSASSALATGKSPPAAAPIMKHMKTFHQKDGMAPQIEVPTNITDDSRMEARRPYRSARKPQMKEPATVPHRAEKGRSATVAGLMPYSMRMPGV